MCIAHRAPITASRLQTFESITDRLQYVYMYMNCALIHYPPPLPVPVLWVSNFKTNMHKIIGGFPFVFSWRKQGRPINPRTPEDSGVDSGESFTPAEHNFLAPEHSNYEFQKLGIRTFWSQIQKFLPWKYQLHNIFPASEQKFKICSIVGKKSRYAPCRNNCNTQDDIAILYSSCHGSMVCLPGRYHKFKTHQHISQD